VGVVLTIPGETPACLCVGGGKSAKTIFMKSALEDFVLAGLSDPADHKFQTHVSAMIEARGKRVGCAVVACCSCSCNLSLTVTSASTQHLYPVPAPCCTSKRGGPCPVYNYRCRYRYLATCTGYFFSVRAALRCVLSAGSASLPLAFTVSLRASKKRAPATAP
jgi:hypothetical protein